MPLYAYIKIPGIGGSQSTDAAYGQDWIPINSMDFSNRGDSGDEIMKERQDIHHSKQKWSYYGKLRQWAQANRHTLTEDVRKELRTRTEQAAKAIFRRAAQTSRASPKGALHELERKYGRKKSSGSLTVDKLLDSTSPKIQRKCLECVNYDTDQYLEGKIELHICRHVPVPEKDTAEREIYMAYILDNCLIESVEFDASESAKLNEKITISFEIIYSCIKLGDEWDIEGWDFVKEAPAPTIANPVAPTPKT